MAEMKSNEWFEPTPADWSVQRMKNIMLPREERSIHGEEELLSVTINEGLIKRAEYLDEDEGTSRAESLVGYKVVSPTNLVNNIMKMGFRCLGVSKHQGIVSPAYSVFELNHSKVDPVYLNFLLRIDRYVAEYRKLSKGIQESRMRLYDDYFLAMKVIVPPLSEQKIISHYLDKKTKQIDSLIDKIEKRIHLLKEQRTSLINHYVTKGLDPHVEMKDSGVDWIGEIPKHWNISPMYTLFDENKVKNKDGRLDVLTLSYGKIKYRDLSKLEGLIPETFDGYQVMEVESIIIRSTDLQNDHKSLRVGYVGIPGVITSAYLGLNPRFQGSSRFFYYSIHLCDLKKVLYGLGGGLRQSLRFDDFKRFPLITPPEDERQRISKHLDRVDQKTNELTNKLERRISLLNEYRETLVSSVVTGQFRITKEMI